MHFEAGSSFLKVYLDEVKSFYQPDLEWHEVGELTMRRAANRLLNRDVDDPIHNYSRDLFNNPSPHLQKGQKIFTRKIMSCFSFVLANMFTY